MTSYRVEVPPEGTLSAKPWFGDFKNVIRAFLEAVRSAAKEHPPRVFHKERWRSANDDLRQVREEHLDYSKALEIAEASMIVQPLAIATTLAATKDPAIVSHFDGSFTNKDGPVDPRTIDLTGYVWSKLFYSITRHYISLKETADWDDARFEEALHNWEVRTFGKEYIEHKVTPIWNFALENMPLRLGNLTLRPSDDRDLDLLWKDGHVQSPMNFVGRPTVTIESINLSPKGKELVGVQVLDFLITSLRLFTPGIPYILITYKIPPAASEWTAGSTWDYRWRPTEQARKRNPLVLDAVKANSFEQFWSFLTKAFGPDGIGIGRELSRAIRRFNSAIMGDDAEDQIIDHVIALEAMLLEDSAELSYRLALRGSLLLGGTSEEMESTRNLLKTAYTRRSEAAHGKELKDFKLEGQLMHPITFIEKLESTVRELVRRFLVLQAQGLSHRNVLDAIEKAITSPEKLADLHKLTKPKW